MEVFDFKKIWSPEIFQGKKRKRNYFEGWYYKLIDQKRQNVFAVIPGISIGENRFDAHAFVQVIDAVKGTSSYHRFDYASFFADPKRLFVRIGDNEFTDYGIKLDLGDNTLKAALEFSNIVKYPKTFFNPGIMGPFTFVPGMECYHGVVNVSHTIMGTLTAEEVSIDLNGGEGYIEKDWGRSFPDSWIWLQANHFEDAGVSFMFSVARIPWLGRSFTGLIAFLMTENGFYKFATYNRSKIRHLVLKDNTLDVRLDNTKYTLDFTAKYTKGGILKAPKNGLMQREIEESITAKVELKLTSKNSTIFSGFSDCAGMEIAGNIKDFLPDHK